MKSELWAGFGRYDGAPKAVYPVAIVPIDATVVPVVTITAPATATWVSVSARIIEASRLKQTVRFSTE